MSNSKNPDLKEVFDKYNKAEPISASFNDERLSGILSGTSNEPMPAKIENLCNVISSVATSITAELKHNTNISEVKIADFTVSSNPNDPDCAPHVDLGSKEASGLVANVSLHVNIQKLINLPAEEVYSRIYSVVYASIFDKTLEKDATVADQIVDNVDLVRGMDEVEEKEAGQNPTLFGRIMKYIANKIKEVLGLDYPEEKINTIAKEITHNYSSAYGGADIVYEDMFDTNAIKGDPSVQQLNHARVSKLISKADMAAAYENPREEMSYRQQATALLSEDVKASFNQMKIGGRAEMQAFCTRYITQMLASNGINIDDLQITFDSVRVTSSGKEINLPQGTFYDGNPKSINVNLDKVKDVTDLIMTLTHETTHAMDSISNTESGITNARGGGLLGVARGVNLDDLGVKKSSEEGMLLSLLNSMAYHLDPNERRGRIAELAGLQFMSEMAGVDSDARKEVDKNIAGFNRYQELTATYVESLTSGNPKDPNSLIALRARYDAIKGRLSESVRQAIDEKFNYIEQALQTEQARDISREQQSIRDAQNISRVMNGQEPVNEDDLQMQ